VILCDPVRSGKTTALSAWITAAGKTRTFGGITAPTPGGVRHVCSVFTGECRRIDADPQDGEPRETTRIGPHALYTDVFLWAQHEIEASVGKELDWLIVDEIGPLELRGEGLEPVLGHVLDSVLSQSGTRLLLVVREHLVDRVIAHYRLDACTLRVVDTTLLESFAP
jgi:nucleoside-triphosphatase THEP1